MGDSFRGCICEVVRIPLKCEDIRNSYISPDWNDMRSIADMNKLYEIVDKDKRG